MDKLSKQDQLYFVELHEKDLSSKEKGKKNAKDEVKGPSSRTRANLRKSFEEEKKELLDIVNLHYTDKLEVDNTLNNLK